MASTSYLARVIYRDGDTGAYTRLCDAKTIGSPIGSPNLVEITSLENSIQTYLEGIKTSDAIEVTANLETADYVALEALKGKTLEFIFLYGSDGLGGVLKVKRSGTVTVAPNDVGGNDEALEMTITITPSTDAVVVTDTVTSADGKSFTVGV